MTNDEALSILHCPDTVGGLYSEKYGEALGMAMEALEKETCEDCISRQMAIEAMGEQPLNWTNSLREIAEEMMRQDHVKALKELPSVTPARAKGEWIYLNAQEESYADWYECSVCHGASYEENFCPNCGAEMELKTN